LVIDINTREFLNTCADHDRGLLFGQRLINEAFDLRVGQYGRYLWQFNQQNAVLQTESALCFIICSAFKKLMITSLEVPNSLEVLATMVFECKPESFAVTI
jgi:hypothetical protein